MLSSIKKSLMRSRLRTPLIYLKGALARPHSQNDEMKIIASLVRRFSVPNCFVEFGFGGWEFNCAGVAYEWEGLLIDGDPQNVAIAKTILPKRVRAKQIWLTLETLAVVRDYARDRKVGILSIDVDGNDYWFLERLIDVRPAVIISEYNSVFGLRPITIPYDPNFQRMDQVDGWYFGASLSALERLTAKHGYSLIAQTGGINAFFVRNDLLGENDRPLTADEAYEARNADKWEVVKHLPFVTISAD